MWAIYLRYSVVFDNLYLLPSYGDVEETMKVRMLIPDFDSGKSGAFDYHLGCRYQSLVEERAGSHPAVVDFGALVAVIATVEDLYDHSHSNLCQAYRDLVLHARCAHVA